MSGVRFGERGEWYVVAQFVLILAVVAGPVQLQGWPDPMDVAPPLEWLTSGLIVAGGLLLLAGARRLGRHLTPLPYPTAAGPLVDHGIYARVRHPIYGGLMLMSFGWAVGRGGGLALVYAALLAALLAAKARREEAWLVARHSGYDRYCRSTWRFLPFIW